MFQSLKNRPVLGWIGLAMTFIKPVLIWALVWCLKSSPVWGSVAILVFIAADILDGVLFRHSTLAVNKKLSRMRRYVDVAGDRLAIQWVTLTAVLVHGFPLSFYAAITTRELVLFSLVAYSFATKRPLKNPNNPSCTAAAFDGLAIIAWLLSGWDLAALCIVMMIGFGIVGAYRYAKTIRHTPKGEPW